MNQDRRTSPRYIALIKAVATVGQSRHDVVCVNVGPAGGYFTAKVALAVGTQVEIQMRPPGHRAPDIGVTAKVVRSVGQGQGNTPGFGVVWVKATSRVGVGPLRDLLRGLLRVADLGGLERSGDANISFDFTQVAASAVNPMPLAARGGLRPVPTVLATPRGAPAPAAPKTLAAEVAGARTASARVPVAAAAPAPVAAPPERPLASAIPASCALPRGSGYVPATPPPPTPPPTPPPRLVTALAAPPSLSVSGATGHPSSQASAAPSGPGTPSALYTGGNKSSSLGGFTLPRLIAAEPSRPSAESSVATPWPGGVPRAIAERYSNLELLGQGGHGIVFRATDDLLDRRVVLKFLASSSMTQETARRYFLREFKVAAALDHPNIVKLYDIGIADGNLYYAMEHVPGQTLGAYLSQSKALHDLDFVRSVMAQLCAALDYAHAQQVLHRDVKPNNVLVTPEGVVKLFDFGLARLQSDADRDQSMMVGTPYYMAPEQQFNGQIDHRIDIYALGVVLFRMVAGRLPFTEGNVFLAHAVAPVPDPRTFNPDLPAELAAVIARMMAKRADDRFPNGKAVMQALAPLLSGKK